MLHVVDTIIPIFVIILLGFVLRTVGLLSSNITGPLNRLVYYIAIPALIFDAVAGAPFHANFNSLLLTGTLAPIVMVFLIAMGIAYLFSIPRYHMGTFLQAAFHGNLGYIGFAVCYYFLGNEGLTRASILAAFVMILQNFLGVFGLQVFSEGNKERHATVFIIKSIIVNPVILSALAGILFSILNIVLPTTVARSLKIISGMALPLALLVIGASLSFSVIKSHIWLTLGTGLLKLFVLPALGLWMYKFFGLPASQFLPGMILLACPTATLTYVMASQMHGSTDLASASVSMNTLLSSLTFIFWLSFFS